MNEPDDIEPVDPRDDARIGAMMEAHERTLEDEALRQFPELWNLGAFGDPAFDEMLEVVRNVLEVGIDAMWEVHDDDGPGRD
jgi:hypothetical protein